MLGSQSLVLHFNTQYLNCVHKRVTDLAVPAGVILLSLIDFCAAKGWPNGPTRGSPVGSRCTGPSSTIMWDTHSPKSRESPLYYGPHCYTHRRRRPPPRTRGGPERTYATPHAATRVRDQSHAHANHTRGGPDRIHRQLVTGRRYTGLTVTFPAQRKLRLSHRQAPRSRAVDPSPHLL